MRKWFFWLVCIVCWGFGALVGNYIASLDNRITDLERRMEKTP
jgi:hypothetical protein